MKRLIAAICLSTLALPAMAEPVELVCNGTLERYGELSPPSEIKGMHLLVGPRTVVVSGGNHLEPTTYTIDRQESDAASLVFNSGRWFGVLNRYSGELTLMPEYKTDVTEFRGHLDATCGKADPLF